MFTPGKRLFGRSAAIEPLVCDYHVIGRTSPVAPDSPGWQEDLDSLFNLVDAQMVERRGVVAPLPATTTPARRAADNARRPDDAARPAPSGPWIGFGLAEDPPAAPEAPLAGLAAAIDTLVARAVEAEWRGPLRDELRDVIHRAVREAVSDALRDAIALAREDRPPVSPASGPPLAAEDRDAPAPARPFTPALVSIRVRRPALRRAAGGQARSAGDAPPPGSLGLRAR